RRRRALNRLRDTDGEREGDREFGSLAHVAADAQRSTMRLCDRLDDRQAQAEPLAVALAADIRAGKTLEDAVQVFRRDTATGVGDRDLDAVMAADRELDPVVGGRVLDGVLHQGVDP